MKLKTLFIWLIVLMPFLLAADVSAPPTDNESLDANLYTEEAGELPENTTSGSGLSPVEPDLIAPSPSPEITIDEIRRALKDYSEDYVAGSSKKYDYLERFFQEVDNMSDELAQKYYNDLIMGGNMLNEFLDILVQAMSRQPISATIDFSYLIGASGYSDEHLEDLFRLSPEPVKGDIQIRQTASPAPNPVSDIAGVSDSFETVITMFADEYNKYKAELKLTVTNDSASTIYLRDIYVSDALRTNPGAFLLNDEDSNNRLTFNENLIDDFYMLDNGFNWPNGSGRFTEWKIPGNDINLAINTGDSADISYVFWFEADVGAPYGYRDLQLFNAIHSNFAASFSNSQDKYYIVNYSGSQMPGSFDIPPNPSDWEAVLRNFAFIKDSELRTKRGFSLYPINIIISGGDTDYRLPADWLLGGYQFTIEGVNWTGNTAVHNSGTDIVISLDWREAVLSESKRSGPSSYQYMGKLTLFRPSGSEDEYSFPIHFFEPKVQVNVMGVSEILSNRIKTFELLMNMSGIHGARTSRLIAQLSKTSPQMSTSFPISEDHLNDSIDLQAALPFGYKTIENASTIDFSDIEALVSRANSPSSDSDALNALTELHGSLTKEMNISIGYSDATVLQRAETGKENIVTVSPKPLSIPTPIPFITKSYERPTRPPAPTSPPYPGIGVEVSLDSHQWIVFKYVIKNNKTWAMLVKREYLPDSPAVYSTAVTPPVQYEGANAQTALTQWYTNEPLPLIKTYATRADNLQYSAADQFSTPSCVIGGVKDILFIPSLRELYDNTMLVSFMQGKIPAAAISPSSGVYGFWTRTQYDNSNNILMYSLADYTASANTSTGNDRWLRPAVWVDADIFMAAPIPITFTPTPTNTPTNTPAYTPTNTPTPTPTNTFTPTPTNTVTPTPTITPSPYPQWVYVLGGALVSGITSIANASEGYIAAGYAFGVPPLPAVIKIDYSGNLVWSNTYTAVTNAYFSDVSVLPGNDYALSLFYGADAVNDSAAIKMNNSGSENWRYTEAGANFSNQGLFYSSDNRIFSIGVDRGKGARIDKFLLPTTTPQATWKWGSSLEPYRMAELKSPSSGYAVCGSCSNSAIPALFGQSYKGGDDGIILGLGINQASGTDPQWAAVFGSTGNDLFTDIISTADGGFLAVGTSNSSATNDLTGAVAHGGKDGLIVKFNSSRAVEWKYLFGSSNDEYFNNVSQSPDGGFMVCGSSENPSGGDFVSPKCLDLPRGGTDAFVAKFSAIGVLEKIVLFGGSDIDAGNGGIIALNNNTFILAGTTFTRDGSGDFNGYIPPFGAQYGFIVQKQF